MGGSSTSEESEEYLNRDEEILRIKHFLEEIKESLENKDPECIREDLEKCIPILENYLDILLVIISN